MFFLANCILNHSHVHTTDLYLLVCVCVPVCDDVFISHYPELISSKPGLRWQESAPDTSAAAPQAGRPSPVSEPSHLAAFPSAFFLLRHDKISLECFSQLPTSPGCVSGYFSAIKGEMETRSIASERTTALYPNCVCTWCVHYNYL